jgi:prepilin-type N-terminal cleavage/methylation domain-containing protein
MFVYRDMENRKYSNKGFSLIELSIVLIIMGFLVAGITGGASLIKSAQLRSVITEYQTYRVAYNTYYGQYSKVPGSTTDDPGTIGSAVGAAWEDLKAEGIIDKTHVNGFVSSKLRVTYWSLENYEGSVLSDFEGLNLLYVSGKDASNKKTGVFNGKDALNLLDKMDDGSPNTGLVRAFKGDVGVPVASIVTTEPDLYGFASKLDF